MILHQKKVFFSYTFEWTGFFEKPQNILSPMTARRPVVSNDKPRITIHIRGSKIGVVENNVFKAGI